jgi:prepilin-type N-terminal cleavage/methylation domain-containing protein
MKISSRLKNHQSSQSGFTLIELLVVIGILAILLAITLIALNPTKHFQGARNAQRSSDVTAILDSIYEYEAANKGTLPPSVSAVTSTPTEIGTGVGNIEPCSDLVPTYIADMPLDPGSGSKTPSTGNACSATSYDSGYMISKSGSNRFTISAPSAEDGAHISVTR